MNDPKQKALQQAGELMKKAASTAAGGIFRRADPENAAHEYGEAARNFKTAGPEHASRYVEALIKSAENYEKISSWNTAARQYEAAASALDGRKGDELKAAQLMASASEKYRMNSQPDRAAENYLKAGK